MYDCGTKVRIDGDYLVHYDDEEAPFLDQSLIEKWGEVSGLQDSPIEEQEDLEPAVELRVDQQKLDEPSMLCCCCSEVFGDLMD